MASACINNIGISSDKFLHCTRDVSISSYSISHDITEQEAQRVAATASKAAVKDQSESEKVVVEKPEESDPEVVGEKFVDFEFRPEDPVTMLPADELFSDGKLVPLHICELRRSVTLDSESCEAISLETPKVFRRNEITSMDPYLFSPKGPRCSSSWKELLGLKKISQNINVNQEDHKTVMSLLSRRKNRNGGTILKHFLHRSSKSSLTASADSIVSTLPLLKDSENESPSNSSRHSLSSTPSGHEHDDRPQLSIDSDKPCAITHNTHQTNNSKLSRSVKVIHHRAALSSGNTSTATRVGRSRMRRASESAVTVRGVSMDSPRMNASGKIVFHNLERSSSSPSSFNGEARYKHRGMEKSYSARIRIIPVLNVPVCSLRGPSKSGVYNYNQVGAKKKRQESR